MQIHPHFERFSTSKVTNKGVQMALENYLEGVRLLITKFNS